MVDPSVSCRVIVKNLGASEAGPSTTTVVFFNNLDPEVKKVSVPTPALGPGGSTSLDFEIPVGCYVGEQACQFKFTVDADDDVAESNEGNNEVESFCLTLPS